MDMLTSQGERLNLEKPCLDDVGEDDVNQEGRAGLRLTLSAGVFKQRDLYDWLTCLHVSQEALQVSRGGGTFRTDRRPTVKQRSQRGRLQAELTAALKSR